MKEVTLDWIKTATAQEIFDRVGTHLLTQNRKSISNLDYCLFFNPEDGCRCAAGCLMSKEEALELNEADIADWGELATDNLVPVNHWALIEFLQVIHDKSNPESWKDELVSLANKYELDASCLDKVTR